MILRSPCSDVVAPELSLPSLPSMNSHLDLAADE